MTQYFSNIGIELTESYKLTCLHLLASIDDLANEERKIFYP